MRNGGGEWLIIICALIVVFAPLIGILTSGRTAMGRTKRMKLSEDAIRAMFAAKIGDIAYEGAAKRSLYDTQRNVRVFLKLQFKLVRSISSMPHREREFLRLYLLMDARGWFNAYVSDRIHFGLVYGDGAASIAHWKFWIPDAASKETGVSNHVDLIRWYAKEFAFGSDAAISELMTVFNRHHAAEPNDPLVREIYAMITSGNCWLSEEDMPNSSFARNRRHGVFVGVLPADGRPLFHYGEGSLVTIAPPGAGKTQCHIVPNLLLWKGPAVVLDIKGELWAKTSAWREANVGPVYRFAPLNPEKSHSYNPLDHIRIHPDFLWEDCMIAAELLVPLLSSKEPFFEQSAQRVLTAVLAYLCYEQDPPLRTMQTVLKVISRVGWDAFLKHAADTDYEPLRNAAFSIRETDEKTLSNVLAQLQTSLKHWTGTRIARITGKSDWRPGILRSGRNPTIYICVSPEELEACMSLLRVLIGQHIRSLTGDMPVPASEEILFLLDEFPQLGHMKTIEQGIEVGRGYKLKLWLVAQSLGQIRNAYKNADGMLGQCGLRAFMNPSLQDGTAQKVSDDIGYYESILDRSRQKVVEPQMLSGPRFRDWQVIFTQGNKPLLARKVLADLTGIASRYGEAPWPSQSTPNVTALPRPSRLPRATTPATRTDTRQGSR